MMIWLYLSLLVLSLWPLFRAWQASRSTTLRHAALWLVAAWLGWGCAFLLGRPEQAGLEGWRYLALCLSACPGIAVLGARRPYAGAWNFVVLSLLGVMLLPLAEGLLLNSSTFGGLRIFFAGATLAVGIFNHLPTRLGPTALLGGLLLGSEMAWLLVPERLPAWLSLEAVHVGLLLLPWLGWLSWGSGSGPDFDRQWRGFRNRYGFVWGQRVREQFNRAADNAGWNVHLTWFGLDQEASPEMLATLHALLRRFEANDDAIGAAS